MENKQLTIKEILEKIGKAECLNCGGNINKTISYKWRIPLCRKCRIEVIEDLEEYEK